MDIQMIVRKLTKATTTLLPLFFSHLSFPISDDITLISDAITANHTLTINNVTADDRVPLLMATIHQLILVQRDIF